MNFQEEKELIRKIGESDREAMERFFTYFYGKVFFLVKRKLGVYADDTGDCRDLTAHILWGTIINIQNGKYEEGKGHLSRYLYGIINNTLKNYFKLIKRNPLVNFSDLMVADTCNNPQQKLEKDLSLILHRQKLAEEGEKEIGRVLEEAIQNLEEKYKKLIYWKYYQELSYEEISRKEKIPLAKVRSRLFDARKKLEKFIRNKLNDSSNFSKGKGNI